LKWLFGLAIEARAIIRLHAYLEQQLFRVISFCKQISVGHLVVFAKFDEVLPRIFVEAKSPTELLPFRNYCLQFFMV
jgi:hypothetical protein